MGVKKLYATPLILYYSGITYLASFLILWDQNLLVFSLALALALALYVLVIDYTLVVFLPDGSFGFGFWVFFSLSNGFLYH